MANRKISAFTDEPAPVAANIIPIIKTADSVNYRSTILNILKLIEIVNDTTPELGGQLNALLQNIINLGDVSLNKTGSIRKLDLVRDEILADNTKIGQIDVKAKSDNTALISYSEMFTEVQQDISLNEAGRHVWAIRSTGTMQEKLILDGLLNAVIAVKDMIVRDTGSSAMIELERNEPTGAGQPIAEYRAVSEDFGGGRFNYANIKGLVEDAGDGTEEGAWEFLCAEAGSPAGIDARRYLALNASKSGLAEFFRNVDLKTNSLLNAVIITPTIASFVNATHDHTNAAGGGSLGANTVDSVNYVDGSIDLVHLSTGAKKQALPIAVTGETEVLAVGTAKITFRMPYAMTLNEVRASLKVAGTGAALVTVDINESGTSVLSTKITIDATEKTSTTAAALPVISDSALADDAEITIDIDLVDTDNVASGLKVYLIGVPT